MIWGLLASIRERAGWFLALLFMAFPAIPQDAGDSDQKQFLPLELLGRDAIVESRVRVVTVSISSGTNNQTDDSESCLIESFVFDDRGNLVLHSPPLVSSDYYYSYDENSKLVDFGRVDSEGGTYSLAEYLEEAASLIHTYEAVRKDDDTALVRSVSSVCFNIDAEYRFSPEFGKNGLPGSVTAHKIRELASAVVPAGASFQSPDILRAEYSYEIWRTP